MTRTKHRQAFLGLSESPLEDVDDMFQFEISSHFPTIYVVDELYL